MFAEIVCGPPGSGKTTYCEGKRQFLSVYDPTRPVTMVNLDPANEGVFPYPCDVDVRELVSLPAVMQEEGLGPNGSYLFCAEVMERHLDDWILTRIEEAVERRVAETIADTAPRTSSSGSGGGGGVRAPYLMIDCPGQVEFYLQSTALHRLFRRLQKRLQCSLCTVHLLDAGIATRDLPTYVSSCVLALTTMVDHELPHVNVLTKWDTIEPDVGLVDGDVDLDDGRAFLSPSELLSESFDRLWRRQLRRRLHARRQAERFATDTHLQTAASIAGEVREAAEVSALDLHASGGRIYRFTKTLMEVVGDYGLVGYTPLDVQNQGMMLRLTQEIDNAMGNFF